MKTVLITGCEGYIGTNLSGFLLGKGYSILGIDQKIGSRVEDFIPDYDIDYIVHLAAISGIGDCEKDPDETIRCNIQATSSLAHYAKELNIPIVFASSQAAKDPKSSLYAFSKKAGEKEVLTSSRNFALRFSNIYGGTKYVGYKSSVIAKFIQAKLENKPLLIDGDGTQTRDFTHVHDICRIIERCFHKKGYQKPIDIGTGQGTSILQLAKMISSKFQFNNTRRVGVMGNVANTTEMKKILGIETLTSLEQNIKEMCL